MCSNDKSKIWMVQIILQSSKVGTRYFMPRCFFALKGMTDKKIGLAGTQRRSIPSHETKCCIWNSLRGKVHVLKKKKPDI